MNVIIIHGAYGYPDENWFGWLKRELALDKIDCYIPHFPTPEGQELNAWMALFYKTAKHLLNEATVLIGHSLGAAFILRWLEVYPCRLLAVVLVGAFLGEVKNEKFDVINRSFFTTPFAWQKIKTCASLFITYYGTNDPYVTRKEFDLIAEKLESKQIIIVDGGHFNSAANYTKFPHLLNELKQIMTIDK